MVKADAYGHGAEKVANALYNVADCFSVAMLHEAKSLRLSGIDKEILVLIPVVKKEIEECLEYNLILTVDSALDLKRINSVAKKLNKIASVHVKFNVGMNRLGVDNLDDLSNILRLSTKLKNLKVSGLFTHFPCPQNKGALKKQIDKFLLAIKLVKGYNKKVICHASASGGFLAKNADFDMVRIGILLYGYYPFSVEGKLRVKVKPALKLSVPVIKTREIKENSYLLYGTKKQKKDRQISLIRLGYADGFIRKSTPLTCNNMAMDVTAVHGKLKNKIVIKDFSKLAELQKTIPYELIVKSTVRAERRYRN